MERRQSKPTSMLQRNGIASERTPHRSKHRRDGPTGGRPTVVKNVLVGRVETREVETLDDRRNRGRYPRRYAAPNTVGLGPDVSLAGRRHRRRRHVRRPMIAPPPPPLSSHSHSVAAPAPANARTTLPLTVSY